MNDHNANLSHLTGRVTNSPTLLARLYLMASDERVPQPTAALTRKPIKELPPIRTDTDDQPQTRRRRKSLRAYRPAVDLNNEKPLPVLRDVINEPRRPAPRSNMSLFSSLFSRPKVQKSRGYTEADLTPTFKDGHNSRPDSLATDSSEPPRSISALSFRTNVTDAPTRRTGYQEPRGPLPDRRPPGWDPPPLFQALAQSTKHGLAEVSMSAPETVLAKSRAVRNRALQVPEGGPRTSTDTSESAEAKRSARTTLKHLGGALAAHGELQRKIFVLVSAGYLLQYAEYGPSGRLPERVLPLGNESAAFASDLIPGRHHVVQVAQAVDKQGVPVAPTASFFSKMSMRSTGAKKVTTNILLALSDGDEMNGWLHALRKQIVEVGGSQTREDTSIEVRSRADVSSVVDLSPERPNAGTRWQGTRTEASFEDAQQRESERSPSPMPPPKDDEPVNGSVAKPKTSLEAEAEAFGDRLAAGASFVPDTTPQPKTSLEAEAEEFGEKLAAGASYVPKETTKPKTSLEAEAEEFGEQLAAGASYVPPKTQRARSPSDAPSIDSSVAQSLDHHRLNSLRGSARMSHSSNYTAITSRTNSMTEDSVANKPSSEAAVDGKTGYRNLSSYGSGKRRSAMPAPSALPAAPEVNADLTLQTSIPSPMLHPAAEDSPVVGRNSPLSPLAVTPPATNSPRVLALSSKHGMPLISEQKARHDSKMVSAPPLVDHSGDRPQSFLGDLPSPATWNAKASPLKRTSVVQTVPSQRQMQRMSSAPALRNGLSQPRLTRRQSSQPFSLPLKVNPTLPAGTSTATQRTPEVLSSTEAHEAEPHVHTLDAQVDTQSRSTVLEAVSDGKPSPPETTQARRGSQKRLSLFPTPLPLPPNHGIELPKRSPSAATPTSAGEQAGRNSLKRPGSIQVRADPTPFLSSLHTSKENPIPQHVISRNFTPPIRSLKPSRSSTAIQTMRSLPETPAVVQPGAASPTDPFQAPKPFIEVRAPSPGPEYARVPSRPIPGGNSFAQAKAFGHDTLPAMYQPRSLKSRTSLPALDLGLPVVGLGPPAPPPSVPLPPPPPLGSASRPASPMPPPTGALPPLPRSAQASPPSVEGLGIRVGGS